jgi:diguanylate cyclase (GGDEF)-like protein/PAS domain S-box-containing protein
MAPRDQNDNQPARAKKTRKSAKKRHVSGRLIRGFNLDLALLSSVVLIIVLLAWLTLRQIKETVRLELIVLSLLILTVLLFFSLLGRLYRSRKEALDQANRATATKNQLQKEMKTRQNAEKILRENEEYIRAVVDSVMDGIITANDTGEIETFNPTAEKMFGYRDSEIVGENLSILLYDNYRERLEKQLGKFSSSGKADFVGTSQEVEGKRKNGSTFSMELLISETRLGDYRKLVAITRDITRHKKLEKRLRLLSTQDGLTGIANRRLFDRTIEVEWSRSVRNSLPISLIMIDIDFFKNYNDSLGHQAGDDALKKIAVTMQQNFMRPGDLVARYGGEEFVALLPETSPNGAAMLAERLRKKIEALKIPHPDSKIGEFVTISLGVAHLIPRRGSRHDKLVSLADKTLYQAKREGRNRVVSMDLSKKTKETAKKGQEN